MSALSVPILAFGLSGTPSGGISRSSEIVAAQMLTAHAHFHEVFTRTSIDRRVAQLAETWRIERGVVSSMSEMVLMSPYQQVIGLGREAVPSILRELSRQPDHWFWALQVITGVNPIPPSAEGNLSAMTKAWLAWAKTEGLFA